MSRARSAITQSQQMNAYMNLNPNEMCDKALEIYNTLVTKNSALMYDYEAAFLLFEKAVNIFKKDVDITLKSTIVSNSRKNKIDFTNYGKALYYLHECYRYGRGVKKNEDLASNILRETIDSELIVIISKGVNEDITPEKLEERQIENVRIKISEEGYIGKYFSLAYHQTALDVMSSIKNDRYSEKDITLINSLYRLAVYFSDVIEKNKKHESDIKYSFFQFMLRVFEHYMKINKDTINGDVWELNGLEMLGMLKELIKLRHPSAVCQYADIITTTDETENPLYYKLYLVFKKHIFDVLSEDQKTISKIPDPMIYYTIAAKLGELSAAVKIAKYKYDRAKKLDKNKRTLIYKEMAWWFWWALIHDDTVQEKSSKYHVIRVKINNNDDIKKYFDDVRAKFKAHVLVPNGKKNTDARVHDYICIQYFKDTYKTFLNDIRTN